MDPASLRFARTDQSHPASAEEEVRIAAMLAAHTSPGGPFEGVMATGSFNSGVAGSLADRPADGARMGWRSRMLAGR